MSVDEYLDFAVQVIKSNLNPESGYLYAARLGLVLRQSNPGVSYEKFGFATLGSLLRAMADRGRVKLVETEKGALAIQLPEEEFRLQPPQSPPSYNPLRKPVWVAFVIEAPSGRRFLHRVSGHVILGIQQSPTPVDEWVEIRPITSDDQREWARAFINEKQIERPEVSAVLESADWYRTFPSALRAFDAGLAREWNRLRSRKISDYVRAWCVANTLPTEFVFQSELRIKQFASAKKNSQSSTEPLRATADVRQVILSALARLSTEALLEIPIPAKYLLEAAQGGRYPSSTN